MSGKQGERKWVLYAWTRIISSLPQLAELELHCTSRHTPHIARCLLGIHDLRKLVLWPPNIRDISSVSCFSTLIAHNPNLSHITLFPSSGFLSSQFDMSVLMRDIPSDRPLKLEHLSIRSRFTNLEALVPHVQPLQSFEFRPVQSRGGGVKPNEWCPIFREANIFPLTIKVDSLDSELVMYLKRHPGVVSLTICQSTNSEWYDALSRVLLRHSKKLRYLALESCVLSGLLASTGNRENVLKCTRIAEIVLIARNHPPPTPADPRPESIRYVSTQVHCIHAAMHVFTCMLGEICPPNHCSPQSFIDGGYQMLEYTAIYGLHRVLQDF